MFIVICVHSIKDSGCVHIIPKCLMTLCCGCTKLLLVLGVCIGNNTYTMASDFKSFY